MMKEADDISSCLKSFCITLNRIRVDESMNVVIIPKELNMPERTVCLASHKKPANKPKYCHIREVLERMSEIRNYGKNNQFMVSPPKKSSKGKVYVEMDELTARELGDRRTGLHTCLMCYKEFKTTVGLRIHNKQHFGVSKWYLCSHCPASFDRKDRCASHMKTHSPVRSYFCHMCGISFESRYESIKHDRIHQIVKKYRCRFCGIKFRTETIYMRHELMHRLKTLHICRICSKSEVSGAALIIHQQIHDKEISDRLPVVNVMLETNLPLMSTSESASFENGVRNLEEDISLECIDISSCLNSSDLELVENEYYSKDTNADDYSISEARSSVSKDLEQIENKYSNDTNADGYSTSEDLGYVENKYCSSNANDGNCSILEDSSVSTAVTVQFPKIRNVFKMDACHSTDADARACSIDEDLKHNIKGYHSNHVEHTGRSARIRRRSEMNNNKPHKCIFC